MSAEDERRRLVVTAAELGAEVARLTAASIDQATALGSLAVEIEKKAWKTTVKIRWMVALVVLDLILSGAMVVGYFSIQGLVKNQEAVRADVLCPLYSIFVSSYNPNSLAAKAQGIDAYNATFAEIRRQYAVLRCVGAK